MLTHQSYRSLRFLPGPLLLSMFLSTTSFISPSPLIISALSNFSFLLLSQPWTLSLPFHAPWRIRCMVSHLILQLLPDRYPEMIAVHFYADGPTFRFCDQSNSISWCNFWFLWPKHFGTLMFVNFVCVLFLLWLWSLISLWSQLDAAATEISFLLGNKPVSQPALSHTLVGRSIVFHSFCSLVSNFISCHL